MGFFDRFTSRKGKERTAGPKRGVVANRGQAAEKKAFASVPSAEADVKPSAPSKKASADQASTQTLTAAKRPTAHQVLLRPIVTEKTTRGGQDSQYTFEIRLTATKAQVRQSIRELYGIKPLAVNISRLPSQAVRFGRTRGRTVSRKKATVTVPRGKTIDVVNT